MTENRRIFLNVIATYGRSLLALACGLFAGRWILMALGPIDYGLFGLIGGLTAFMAFFNQLLSSSVGRFYAYSIGAASVSKDDSGLETCRKWFNTAVTVHTVVPTVLLLIGVPLGEYAVLHWLTIPPNRISVCVWVWRFAAISCFVSMANVPFSAMYTAKQYIAELTVFSVIQTVLNVILGYCMVSRPGDWLFKYSLFTCLIYILPQMIICVRALVVFPECKINPRYWFDWQRIRQIGSFAGWQIFGTLGSLMRAQGIAIVVNKNFGPKVNAAMGVANSVNAQAGSLSSALVAAFMPVITQACGAGDYDKMKRFAIRSCKFGALLALLFFIPLMLELDAVLVLWLKNPPQYTTPFCLTMIFCMLIDKSTIGHMVVLSAVGKIALYQMTLGCVLIATIPIALVLLLFNLGVYAICLALGVSMLICSIGRVIFAKYIAKMSARAWMKEVILPCLLLSGVAAIFGMIPRFLMAEGVLRILVTTAISEVIIMPLAYFGVCTCDEREFIRGKVVLMRHKIWRN